MTWNVSETIPGYTSHAIICNCWELNNLDVSGFHFLYVNNIDSSPVSVLFKLPPTGSRLAAV